MVVAAAMPGRGVAALLLLLALLAVGTGTAAGVTGLGRRSGTRKSSRSSSSGGSGVGGEGSILQALLDSQYSELVGLLDKASMLEELERRVSEGGITVLAPKNSYLEQHFDPELRAFLLRPGHVSVLQRVLKFHILPVRVEGAQWSNRSVATLAGDSVSLRSYGLRRFVDYSRVFSPNSIVRKDGVAHGVSGLLIPRRVALQFAAWKRGDKFAVQPAGSPEGAPSHSSSSSSSSPATPYYGASAPALAPMPSFPAMGPGPALAPAPGPSQEVFSWNEEDETLHFITALQNYGGYNDMADLLVNYTSLGVELGKLVKAGYKLTILAPNDQAMQQLGPEHLNSPLERILYYHMLSEYQTEDSLYSTVRRLGKQSYSTLQHPLKLVATESDGTVQFGAGDNSAQIYDHDIYVDGHLSIQGISKVLIPPPPH